MAMNWPIWERSLIVLKFYKPSVKRISAKFKKDQTNFAQRVDTDKNIGYINKGERRVTKTQPRKS
jgi:hypothetical protein